MSADARSFACHPRVAQPLCGPGWLACGSAALGFDPLCGDGSGYAAREAILASAVVRAASQGSDTTELLDHYRARLLAGFEKHLEVCAEFYRSGHSGPWWDEQQAAAEKGLAWCHAQRADSSWIQIPLERILVGTGLRRTAPVKRSIRLSFRRKRGMLPNYSVFPFSFTRPVAPATLPVAIVSLNPYRAEFLGKEIRVGVVPQ